MLYIVTSYYDDVQTTLLFLLHIATFIARAVHVGPIISIVSIGSAAFVHLFHGFPFRGGFPMEKHSSATGGG